jgi:hypothetical protein
LKEYRSRREHYALIAEQRGLNYSDTETINDIRRTIAARGYTVSPRRLGEIHTLAFIPQLSWHKLLLPDLEELGPLTLFDCVSLGFDPNEFYRSSPSARERRKQMNRLFVSFVIDAHRQHPVDWVFLYGSGLEIARDSLREIQEAIGVPTVNMCFDDKQSWTGHWMGDHRSSQIDIARWCDVSWTSARVACEWYLVEGARPIYLPEGFDISSHQRRNIERDLEVSFVGQGYGFRTFVINALRSEGIRVATFGRGWTGSGWAADPVEIMSRSRINLGLGGIGYCETLTNVKARDFEAPAIGAGVYLTSFNADLAQHFHIGREILCYRDIDEAVDLIRHYLKHIEEADAIASAGRLRCLNEHRWLHRYQYVCGVIGLCQMPSRQRG